MRRLAILLVVAAIVLGMTSGCATAPKDTQGRRVLAAKVDNAIMDLAKSDPFIQNYFDQAYGYAVFPCVANAAFIVGAAGGKGEVWAQGERIGYARIAGLTAGATAGAQSYREIIFFENQDDLRTFTRGTWEWAGQAGAVIWDWGGMGKSPYFDGTAVYTDPAFGAMVDLSLGGYDFNFKSNQQADVDQQELNERNQKHQQLLEQQMQNRRQQQQQQAATFDQLDRQRRQ